MLMTLPFQRQFHIGKQTNHTATGLVNMRSCVYSRNMGVWPDIPALPQLEHLMYCNNSKCPDEDWSGWRRQIASRKSFTTFVYLSFRQVIVVHQASSIKNPISIVLLFNDCRFTESRKPWSRRRFVASFEGHTGSTNFIIRQCCLTHMWDHFWPFPKVQQRRFVWFLSVRLSVCGGQFSIQFPFP